MSLLQCTDCGRTTFISSPERIDLCQGCYDLRLSMASKTKAVLKAPDPAIKILRDKALGEEGFIRGKLLETNSAMPDQTVRDMLFGSVINGLIASATFRVLWNTKDQKILVDRAWEITEKAMAKRASKAPKRA